MARLSRVEDKRAKNECDKYGKDAEYRHKRHARGYPARSTGWDPVTILETTGRLHRRISVCVLWNSKGVEGDRELCKSRARPI